MKTFKPTGEIIKDL